ncbi:EAL domain-containing protein [Dactylosporangium sp. NPDC049525]|uniref:putative bifunctional diguanylate cyclase/phosphodiesterase n=1 Tax=Dactylosporangium sp. NPDC049525 TaxID=3154730 RepID=UPI00342F164C
MPAAWGLPSSRRLVGAVAGCLLAGASWTAVYASGMPVPKVLALLAVPVAMGLAAIIAHVASGTPGLPAAGRRFWRLITASIALVGIGATIIGQARLNPAAPDALRLVKLSAPALVLGVGLALYALLRLPTRTQSRGEWVRLGLDALTVLITTALFLWHLALRPMVERHTDVRLALGLLLLSTTCLVALVAVTKVVLLGSGPVSPRSMRLLAAAVLAGGLGSAVSPLIASPRWVGLQPMITLLEALLVACAAHAQTVPLPEPAAPAVAARGRAYSKLPYFAVAATSLLLAAVAYGDHADVGPVATGAIAVSAVVGLRQLVALRDNAQLLTSVRRHEQRLRYQASHDALTALVNRARFTELLDEALALPTVAAHPVAVLLIDLDDFKLINDTLGHGVGDEVLVTVAERLQRAVRHDDVVARLGGDEFAMLLRDVDGEHAVDVAGRIRDTLSTPIHTAGHDLLVHASVGVATSAHGDRLDTLLRNADLAMYAAKERGKGGHFVYVPGMTTRIVAHAELGAQLRDAIEQGQLFLLYQPIVRLDDGHTTATEALVRWRHPERGIVPPCEFIPAAEQTGLIVTLGRWVLREACRQQAQWLRDLGAGAPQSVSVNVAGRQLTDPQFVADVAAALDDAGLDPWRLTLEVTETAVLDRAEAIATLHALRGLQVRLALDDFGTAASSLGLLLTCPVTSLKLDRTFVDGITAVARQEAVATAVIRMAQALDLSAVAEGIETEEQARMLRHLGYRFGQGYLYARPLAAADVAALPLTAALPLAVADGAAAADGAALPLAAADGAALPAPALAVRRQEP